MQNARLRDYPKPSVDCPFTDGLEDGEICHFTPLEQRGFRSHERLWGRLRVVLIPKGKLIKFKQNPIWREPLPKGVDVRPSVLLPVQCHVIRRFHESCPPVVSVDELSTQFYRWIVGIDSGDPCRPGLASPVGLHPPHNDIVNVT